MNAVPFTSDQLRSDYRNDAQSVALAATSISCKSAPAEAKATVETPSVTSAPPVTPISNSALTIRLKELDLELRRQQVRALEIQAEKEIRLRQLELEAQRVDKSVTSPRSSPSRQSVLAAPDFERPFKLEVNVSNIGARAVLLQEDNLGRPGDGAAAREVAYSSCDLAMMSDWTTGSLATE
ncbi:hypothetical protein AOLI_G00098240 [Acnodon oligacanthus]